MKIEFFLSIAFVASIGRAAPADGGATRLAECRLTGAEAEVAEKAAALPDGEAGQLDAAKAKLLGFQVANFAHKQVTNQWGKIKNRYVSQVVADFGAVKVAALRGSKQSACVGEHRDPAGLRNCMMNPPVVNRAPAIMQILEKPDHVEVSCIYVPLH